VVPFIALTVPVNRALYPVTSDGAKATGRGALTGAAIVLKVSAGVVNDPLSFVALTRMKYVDDAVNDSSAIGNEMSSPPLSAVGVRLIVVTSAAKLEFFEYWSSAVVAALPGLISTMTSAL
jgi:hypothetical protein